MQLSYPRKAVAPEADMRRILFLVISGCSSFYGEDDVEERTLCVTVNDHEVCGEATAQRFVGGGETRFTVTADTQVSGVDFGWEQASARIEGVVPTDAELPFELDALVGVVPARVTCILDDAHGDHCHLGIAYERACELGLGEVTRVVVDRLDDSGVHLRFAGTSSTEVPACCVSTCDDLDRSPWTEPELPFAYTGAVRAAWSS